MILKHLSLTNYKNIELAHLSFSDKFNCVIGANGMGKTNLLDSIYYLSFTRSNQYLPDSMIIRHGEGMAIISGEYEVNGGQEQVFFGLQQGRNKTLKRNKKEYTRMADHVGLFPLVMIAPSDIDLIKGGSTERRSFMDQFLCQESREYMTIAKNYKSLVEHRNKMLKQEMGLDLSLLDVVNQQMSIEAERISRLREEWIERITPLFHHYYNTITGGNESVHLRYLFSIDKQPPEADDFLQVWQSSLQGDLACGFTRIGPHRDDIEMLISDYLIRKIGSQGQNKSYMIALKLAQYNLLCQLYPHNLPILLLDDVFDKLDERRVERIVDLLSGDQFGQIFMSDTNRKYLDKILQRQPKGSYSIFSAYNGTFTDITDNEALQN